MHSTGSRAGVLGRRRESSLDASLGVQGQHPISKPQRRRVEKAVGAAALWGIDRRRDRSHQPENLPPVLTAQGPVSHKGHKQQTTPQEADKKEKQS